MVLPGKYFRLICLLLKKKAVYCGSQKFVLGEKFRFQEKKSFQTNPVLARFLVVCCDCDVLWASTLEVWILVCSAEKFLTGAFAVGSNESVWARALSHPVLIGRAGAAISARGFLTDIINLAKQPIRALVRENNHFGFEFFGFFCTLGFGSGQKLTILFVDRERKEKQKLNPSLQKLGLNQKGWNCLL